MMTGRHLHGHAPDAMDFRFVFLEPKGRLAPRPFGQGLVILTAVMLVLVVLTGLVAPDLGVLQNVLVYPYLCLFAKRLHDAGLSAWLWLAFVAGFLFVNFVATAILLPILSPGSMAMQAEFESAMRAGGISAGMDMMAARSAEFMRETLLTSTASFLIASGITGYAAYTMRSDRRPNRHGPPTDGSARADTFS